MGNKYHAEKTIVDGITFASKKEARYYQELCLARTSGQLLFFLRQVPFHLPGGVRYVVDFAEFWKNEPVRFVDVKGFPTATYKIKKKILEACYPVKIIEG